MLHILSQCARHPLRAIGFARRVFQSKDRIYLAQSGWTEGALPRVSLQQVLLGCETIDIKMVQAANRTWMTSITLEELCCVLVFEKWIGASRILEIGTADGNTALCLAANAEGVVVTVDLPLDWNPKDHQSTLAYSQCWINITSRENVGKQFRDHPLGHNIRQVYGDSALLDWNELGGPFDLVFIDGCHGYEYVRSDTENALGHLSTGGGIVWHDYGMIRDVSDVVDWVANESKDLEVYALEGTRLAIGIKKN